MGKKEKSEKKKGSFRKLSKCLFFWGNKRSGKESKQENSLKKAHSESSVANTPYSGNLVPSSSEQGVDTVEVGECSNSRSHFHIQISDEIADIPELKNFDQSVMPSGELQLSNFEETSVQDLKESCTNKNARDISDLERANNSDANTNKSTFQKRFIVTSISEASREYDSSNKIHPNNSENIITPKNEEKAQDKPPVYQSKFNVCKNDTNELLSKEQVCQPNLNSDNRKNDHTNDSKPSTLQHNLSVTDNTNGNYDRNSEPQICKPSLKTVSDDNFINNQSKPQIYQPNLNTAKCTNMIDQKSETQIFQPNLASGNYSNKTGMHHPKSKSFNLSSDNHINTVDELCTKSTLFQSSRSSTDQTSDPHEHNSEPESLQSKMRSENCDEGQKSESQIFQPTLRSDNHTNDINKEQSVSQICQSNPNSDNYIKNVTEQQISHADSVPKHNEPQIYQPNCTKPNDIPISKSQIDLAELDSADFITEIPQTEAQYDLGNLSSNCSNKSHEATDGEEKDDLDKLEVGTTDCCEVGDTLSSANHVDSNQVNLNMQNKDESVDSCLGNNQFKMKEMPKMGELDYHSNNQSLNSYSHANTQGYDKYKANGVSEVAEQHDSTLPTTKPDGKHLKNINQEQLVENYPSINLIKGTSDIGMTLVVLPYLNPARENENWKVLSDLATKGNYQTDINKSSEMLYSQENQASIPKKEENKPVQGNNVSASAVKQSRVPVRRSVGSEDIVEKISKVSTEIEEINTSIKQKSIPSSIPRLNSRNRSKSKIPRKCANDSLSPK